jgi:hypothetical protein
MCCSPLAFQEIKYTHTFGSFTLSPRSRISTSRPGLHCKDTLPKIENSKQIFPEKELRGLSPNFNINVSVSDLYIHTQFLYWDYINGIFVAVFEAAHLVPARLVPAGERVLHLCRFASWPVDS